MKYLLFFGGVALCFLAMSPSVNNGFPLFVVGALLFVVGAAMLLLGNEKKTKKLKTPRRSGRSQRSKGSSTDLLRHQMTDTAHSGAPGHKAEDHE